MAQLHRTITPLAQIDRRAPEAGRIRMGDKRGTNGSQRALNHWRLTSPDREILEQVATRYGGTVQPWKDPKASPPEQFEVYTETNELYVMVVRDGLSSYYEMWSGGGVVRRCDGLTCQVPQPSGPSDWEMVDVPCVCREENRMQCKPHTRLVVVLPEFQFLGTWRVETKSWNALVELPGMYDVVNTLNQRGRMIDATLILDKRSKMERGKRKHFVVPRLALRNSVAELSSGTSMGAIGTGQMTAQSGAPELTAGTLEPDAFGVYGAIDEGIADGEVIDDELLEIEALLKADAINFGIDEDAYVEAIKGRTQGDRASMRKASAEVRVGNVEPTGISQGVVQWRRLRREETE